MEVKVKRISKTCFGGYDNSDELVSLLISKDGFHLDNNYYYIDDSYKVNRSATNTVNKVTKDRMLELIVQHS